MDDILEPALVRQRKMKRLAKALFALAVLAVVLPVLMGLLGNNLAVPVSLLAAVLIIVGVIIWIRSDPAYARALQKRNPRR
ncbi:hypothetical protein [uncultured Arthrobacter sp.]|uniref:hypothetical protein n=1 Tax=uncultured Arthrobacter sp. TaxID=114050 RepID=UPI002630762D|nr:hypothetical protein [uncultured Arthrobacter sp.]